MASLMYLCVLLLALVALPDSGSAALCSNPDSYKGKIVSNPWGSRRGESESFVQVNAYTLISYDYSYCWLLYFDYLNCCV